MRGSVKLLDPIHPPFARLAAATGRRVCAMPNVSVCMMLLNMNLIFICMCVSVCGQGHCCQPPILVVRKGSWPRSMRVLQHSRKVWRTTTRRVRNSFDVYMEACAMLYFELSECFEGKRTKVYYRS